MRNKQRGVALLIIALILGLATAGFFFSKFSARNIEQERAAETTAALAEAKAALLGFAMSFEVSNSGRYGFLPCPEVRLTFGLEGSASSPCGDTYASSIGRLPWRSLRSPPWRDGDKECLWYAVSGAYKNSATANHPSGNTMHNADSLGQFSIVTEDGTILAGATPETRAVAVIFSSGRPFASQDRTRVTGLEQCPGNYIAANYLDSVGGISNAAVQSTNDRVDTFVVSSRRENFNDRLVFITRDEIFSFLINRASFETAINGLTERIAMCFTTTLAGFGPANLNLADYRRNNEYVSMATLTRGRVPRDVTNCPGWSQSQIALWRNWKDHFFYARCNSPCTVNGGGAYDGVVFFSGRRLNGQARRAPPLEPENTKGQIRNYLEGCNSENFASGTNFQTALGGGGCPALNDPNTFNDTLYCIRPSGSNPRVALCS